MCSCRSFHPGPETPDCHAIWTHCWPSLSVYDSSLNARRNMAPSLGRLAPQDHRTFLSGAPTDSKKSAIVIAVDGSSRQQADDFLDRPNVRGEASFHRRRHAQRLMHAPEVVIHEV